MHKSAWTRVVILCTVFITTNDAFKNSQKDLAKFLLESNNYDKRFKPQSPTEPATTLHFGLRVMSVIDVDASTETIRLKQVRTLRWRDPWLSWIPTDHDNITELTLPTNDVWVPYVFATQLDDVRPIEEYAVESVLLHHNGQMMLAKYEKVIASCSFNVQQFPSDQQKCSIEYSTMMMTNDSLNMISAGVNCKRIHMSEWNRINCTLENSYTTGRKNDKTHYFATVNFTITMTRKSGFYFWTQTVPCMIIAMLTLVGLYTPSENSLNRSEKIGLGLTSLLALSVVLVSVAETLPKNFDSFPKLGLYILVEIFYVAINTVIAVLVMYLHAWLIQSDNIPPVLAWIVPVTENEEDKKSKSAGFRKEPAIDSKSVNPSAEYLKRLEFIVRQHLLHVKSSELHEQRCNRLCVRLDGALLVTSLFINTIIALALDS